MPASAACVAPVCPAPQLVRKPCGIPPPPGHPVTAGAGVNEYHWAKPLGTSAVSANVEGCSPMRAECAVLKGLGTVSSQLAYCKKVFFAGWATLPLVLPPSGGRRLGSGLVLRFAEKLSGSAGSRIHFATSKVWRYLAATLLSVAILLRSIPRLRKSASTWVLNAGALVKVSTSVPPPTASTALPMRGLAATSSVPRIAPSEVPT